MYSTYLSGSSNLQIQSKERWPVQINPLSQFLKFFSINDKGLLHVKFELFQPSAYCAHDTTAKCVEHWLDSISQFYLAAQFLSGQIMNSRIFLMVPKSEILIRNVIIITPTVKKIHPFTSLWHEIGVLRANVTHVKSHSTALSFWL